MTLNKDFWVTAFGLLGAIVSVFQILKMLHTLITSIEQIKSSIRLTDRDNKADIELLKQMVMSNREDYTRRCNETQEEIEKLNLFISKYITFRGSS